MTTRADRLRSPQAVRAVFAARTVATSRAAVVHARRRDDDRSARVAVVAGKSLGHAVARNRVKRRLRAAAAGIPAQRGLDIVIVGRPAALTMPFDDLRTALAEQLRTAESAR